MDAFWTGIIIGVLLFLLIVAVIAWVERRKDRKAQDDYERRYNEWLQHQARR